MNVSANFADAIAAHDGQPRHVFDALCALARRTVGARLFTLMRFDAATREARRIYSNMPEAYPEQGTKPVNETRWTAHVLDGHETFIANDIDGIAEVFGDHELIASLGCESVMNVPVVVDGQVLGTINCLDRAGHYTAERVAAADALRLPGAAAFLLDRFLAERPA